MSYYKDLSAIGTVFKDMYDIPELIQLLIFERGTSIDIFKFKYS